jgi:hypothetical protein
MGTRAAEDGFWLGGDDGTEQGKYSVGMHSWDKSLVCRLGKEKNLDILDAEIKRDTPGRIVLKSAAELEAENT